MENNAANSQEKSEDPVSEKRWILVVDDEPGFRNLLHWYLTEHGLNVLVAQDGLEAIALAKEKKFALVITDLTMPRLDGIKLLEEIKKNLPKSSVIIATGFGTVETAVSAMKKGAFDFILKPFDMEKFVILVKEALSVQARVG